MNKKIVLIANSAWYLFNFRLNLCLALQKLNYSVSAIAPYDAYADRFKDYGIDFISIDLDNQGTNPIKDGLFILRLLILLKQQRPACILSFTPKCNIYVSFSARLLTIPIVQTVSGLGTAFIHQNTLTKIVKILYRLALSYSSRVFFQNQDDRNLFIEQKLVNAKLTDLIAGSGVNTDYFIPIEKQENTVFTFLCVARLLKDKGIIELITACRLLKQENVAFRCQLLGFLDVKNPSAITREELQTWVNDDLIDYLGESDDVRSYLYSADCVVLPSYREGVPRCLLEAASMAKPIITTDVVGCREVVDDQINGFLCAVKNALDLKNKMKQMLNLSNEQRAEMGKNGRIKMLKQFDERKVIEQYIKTIQFITAY